MWEVFALTPLPASETYSYPEHPSLLGSTETFKCIPQNYNSLGISPLSSHLLDCLHTHTHTHTHRHKLSPLSFSLPLSLSLSTAGEKLKPATDWKALVAPPSSLLRFNTLHPNENKNDGSQREQSS